jgi:hypothetical protein
MNEKSKEKREPLDNKLRDAYADVFKNSSDGKPDGIPNDQSRQSTIVPAYAWNRKKHVKQTRSNRQTDKSDIIDKAFRLGISVFFGIFTSAITTGILEVATGIEEIEFDFTSLTFLLISFPQMIIFTALFWILFSKVGPFKKRYELPGEEVQERE